MDQDERLKDWLDHYSNRLYRLAYTMSRNAAEAEDHVQEAFIKAYYAMNRLDPERPTFPWLARIVINECRMSHRRTFRETLARFLPEKSSISTEEHVLETLKRDDIYRLVLELSEKLRVPIVLYYFEDLSIDDIAETLDIRPGTVKSRLSRGRAKLEHRLKEEPEYDRGKDSTSQKLI